MATQLNFRTAALLVVANMIGSGIFATLGYMALGIQSPGLLLLAWALGGIVALCGALSYSELAASMPRSGGEYHYLSVLYHPVVGFLSGFVSLIVGFGAPIAGACLVFGSFALELAGAENETLLSLGNWSLKPSQLVALALAGGLTLLHSRSVVLGARVQNAFTLLKVGLVLVFIVAGLLVPAGAEARNMAAGFDWSQLASAAFGTGLALVFFAYSGWNAATYITGEVKDPQRNVPRALLGGTLLVTVLYLLLNYVFLRSLGVAGLAGKGDFAKEVAEHIFGQGLGWAITALVAFALISSASSMVMAGPRVTAAMGEDFALFARLARRRRDGAPATALLLQLGIVTVLVVYGNVMVIFQYIGLTLSLFAALTVGGVFLNRRRRSEALPYRMPWYPLPPLVFLLLAGWLIMWSVYDFNAARFQTEVPLISAATLALGLLVYYFAVRRTPKPVLP